MIVTKKQEQQFLIKKNCWLLETDLNGEFKMVNTSIHWKEGMEVFESMHDCLAELNRRKEISMSEGHCPRCNYRSLVDTVRDITALPFMQIAKQGKLYQCDSCKTIWYKYSKPAALAYDERHESDLMDWASRNIKPTKEIENILLSIGDISALKGEMEFPAHVILKTGFELTHVLIKLNNRPPDPTRFKRKDWYYLDEVKEVNPSAFAYPFHIARHIRLNQNSFVDIKTKNGTDIIRFDAHAGVFMPAEYVGQKDEFELVDSEASACAKSITNIYEVADRGGSDFWGVTPPEKPIVIFGELKTEFTAPALI